MTNRRAIQRAATREANTLTHNASTMSRLPMAIPSTNQSSKNQTIGAAMRRSTANGCNSFWNLNRDLSGAGASRASDSGIKGVGTQNSGGTRPGYQPLYAS